MGLERISRPHTDQNLARIVEGIVTQFNLIDRLLAITCGNASDNSTLYRSLEEALCSQDIEWSAKAIKVSFLAHVFNLFAKAFLVGLNATNADDAEDVPPEHVQTSPELIPYMATNDVALTFIKVMKACLTSFSRG